MKYLILSILIFMEMVSAGERVERILKTGVLRVGTTGDYRPFTLLEGKTYSGYDIEVAQHMASELGVKLVMVPTTWKSLIRDLEIDRFDLAMGGITRKLARKIKVELSDPYLTIGKCPIVRKADRKKYLSLKMIDRKGVVVGVNIGGTNEKFADQYLRKARVIKYQNNLEVPLALINGEIDVMISETPEAIYYDRKYPELVGLMIDNPMTKSQLGYLIFPGAYDLLSVVNFIMHEMELKGVIAELKAKHLK